MSGKSNRPLTEEDKAIWKKVARTVTPNHRRKDLFETLLGDAASPKLSDKGPYIRVVPKKAHYRPRLLPELQAGGDKRTRRGRVSIDQKIDLHDMTRDQARSVLLSGVRAAYLGGKRCLLIVTGKGRALDGVLRTHFPIWINEDDIRPMISAFSQAHIRHGGSGAWYVFIKRRIHV